MEISLGFEGGSLAGEGSGGDLNDPYNPDNGRPE